ncbi:TatD family hydrolase [Pontiella sulfatireligans]|uniref:Putative metal-dependent hydrolase YcfH n=1 Tax=Pontiella sulfatireligans TaxID=2750658 RepID=A0A6C2UMV6_9BACT|nr:TatD family hydrolase [Pontiella sulfatireligans]VGO21478.1 putative metal-dependent hydrolase YcfH [Pontiella sulfatireligans]
MSRTGYVAFALLLCIMFIDTHVHFDRFVKDGSFPELLENAKEALVLEMVAIGGSAEANALSLKLAAAHPGRIFGCAGYDRDKATEDYDLSELGTFLANPLVKAVGETGLDYYYTAETATEQKKLFAENLELAAEFEKPVVVHTRDADEDTLALLTDYSKAWKGDPARLGVLHCFTREAAFARQVLDLGLMISFSGIVSFANAEPLRKVVQYVPDDRLLIETDSPYLAPVPMRGNRNEPAFVVHVAKQLAELKGCSVEFIANLTATNARSLFAL